MKKLILLISQALLLVSCGTGDNPYADSLHTLRVDLSYPSDYTEALRAGINVVVEDVNLGTIYTLPTEASAGVDFKLSSGVYRVSFSDLYEESIFNGSVDKLILDSDKRVLLSAVRSKAGTIVFKEIYCGGCLKLPEQGTYQSDQYIILHNNDFRTQYLDSLCFGTLYPYNSNATNPFLTRDSTTGDLVYPDYAPIAQCVWQFGGDGKTFPLEPGEDAVVALRGAIDHSEQYPLSVNLNREGYFVCYNNTYFTNTTYHPAPGNNIALDHYLGVVIKTGIANAYTFSINSPTAVIFKAPAGTSMSDYVLSDGAVVQVPGSSSDRVTAIPYSWILDAVEVFNGSSSSNVKRLVPEVDAGYVSLSETFLGHTLMRRTDDALTSSMGFEVLQDTNNSTNDFYERDVQSLHE